jgi:serine/threonine protein kinase
MNPTTFHELPERRTDRVADPSDVRCLANDNLPTEAPIDRLGQDLAHEFRLRWHRGEQLTSEQFLNEQPQLWHQPEVAVDVIYEEYCQRLAAGHEDVERDILSRFPQWEGPLRLMLDCHRVLQPGQVSPRFPVVGERIGEFELLAELVRGSHGRVFLANQTALADRPVVLKITPLDGGEHLTLARLQHTNIVPLYVVVDDTVRRIRILCMPYFGRTTLASLLESLRDVPLTQRTGQHVLAVIDQMGHPVLPSTSAPPAVAGAARQMLSHASYVQAMCWMTACLADALQYAHERGLLHLDLKPSNVLLATDGQPMLLDFHLAHEPIRSDSPLPDHFGGTPGYMPPEQQAALHAFQEGRLPDAPVDGRADIYALGVMLHESLGGRMPICPAAPPLSQLNPQVSVGLSDLVAKCIASCPGNRYADAAALADDLRRHLTDQPLAGVSNRSFTERWYKLRRRRPNLFRAVVTLVLAVGTGAFLLSSMWSNLRDRRQQAEQTLRDGLAMFQIGEHDAQTARTFEHGLALVKGLPFQRELERQLREQLAEAKRRAMVCQLHRLAEEIRVHNAADTIPPNRLRTLVAQGREFWRKRHTIKIAVSSQSGAGLAADFQDIAIFLADLRVKQSTDADVTSARHEALRWLDETESLFGSCRALAHERQLLRGNLGLADPPGLSSANVTATAPRSAREHYTVGRALLASGDLASASRELTAARELDPAGLWPNFYYGLLAYRLGRWDDSVSAFSVCVGASPNLAGCFYNRALAYTALGRREQAMRDYDQTLRIDPTHAAALLNRGMLLFEAHRFEEAKADLHLALKHGAPAATVHYDQALVHLAANDPQTALVHLRDALRHDPAHEPARQLADRLRRELMRRPFIDWDSATFDRILARSASE